MLVDRYGRVATDLRVSLTDRCNLRCAYCMPAEGLNWLPTPEVLTDDEVVRLVRVAVERLGVRQVRFTGGEPLLRRGLVDIVRRCSQLLPRPELSLTTNGIGLARLAQALAEAGLDRVNGSLDTLDPHRFEAISRRRRLPDVLDGLEAAAAAGLVPVKINAVLMRGINEDEAPRLLRWALDRGYEMRFIEQMPLDPQHGWNRVEMVTAEEILASLSDEFRLTPIGGGRARECSGRDLARRRRPGPGGSDRLGNPAVLRRLRSDQVDSRRPGSHLPVRARGVRPARAFAQWGERRRAGPALARGHGWKAGGPWHRRAGISAAVAPDVGHRRLSARAPERRRRTGQRQAATGEAARRRRHNAHRRGNAERARTEYCTESLTREG